MVHVPKHVGSIYLIFMYIFNTVRLVGAINWRQRSLTCSQQSAICRHPEPSETILRHLTLQLYIHFNNTLPFKHRPPKRSLPSGFVTKTLYVVSLNKCQSPLNSSALIWSPEEHSARYTNYRFSHCAIFPSLLLFPSLVPSIFLCSLFSNTLSLQKIQFRKVSYTFMEFPISPMT